MSDDELIAELERAGRGEVPSPFGELSLTLPRGPVSQQATLARKAEFSHELRTLLAKYQFILTSDIQLELEWLVHERTRYESDEAPDVDNVIKPLLDAMSGPNGIIVDDCQVQSVASSWIDWTREKQELRLRIRHIADDYVLRSSLAFVEVGAHLYLPVDTSLSVEAKEIIGKAIEASVGSREKLTELGANWHAARAIMPTQRVFHRSRLGTGFRRGSLEDYRLGRL